MATSVGQAFLAIVPDVSRFKSDLTKQVDAPMSSSMRALGGKMQKFGLGLTAGVTAPLTLLAKSSITAFQESQKVTAQTEAVIKSTGAAAGVTADQVSGLASSISEYSGIDDEAIAAGENLLLTFTNIRNEAGKGNDIFNRTTTVLADMATAMGTDAKSQAIQLGKALNDPVKGITALTRVGVTFTDQQRKQIAAMVDAGDTAGAQRVILDELTKEFGGSAKAFGDTSAGEAAKAQVAWGNAMEDIGSSLAPVVSQIAELVQKVAGWFSSLPAGAKTAIVVIGALLAVLGPVVGLIGTIITIAPALGAAFSVMLGPVGLVILALAALVALGVLIVKNWDTIKRVAGRVWHAITGAVRGAFQAVKRAALGALDWLKRNWPVILAVITGPIGLAVLAVVKNWAKIRDAARAAIDWIKGAWRTVGDVVRSVWDGIRGFIGGVWRGITGAVRTGLNTVVDLFNRWILSGVNTIIRTINKVPGVPDIPEVPLVPHLARGGIITSPTIALLGEAGPEAVVPLGVRGPIEIVGRLTLDEEGVATIRAVVRDELGRDRSWSRGVGAMR